MPVRKFDYVCSLLVSYAVYVWFREDARYGENRDFLNGMFDAGWHVFATWPLIIPYYLIKTRKWRGFFVLVISIFVATLAAVAGAFFGRILQLSA